MKRFPNSFMVAVVLRSRRSRNLLFHMRMGDELEEDAFEWLLLNLNSPANACEGGC